VNPVEFERGDVAVDRAIFPDVVGGAGIGAPRADDHRRPELRRIKGRDQLRHARRIEPLVFPEGAADRIVLALRNGDPAGQPEADLDGPEGDRLQGGAYSGLQPIERGHVLPVIAGRPWRP
jgi:hypothetical protein